MIKKIWIQFINIINNIYIKLFSRISCLDTMLYFLRLKIFGDNNIVLEKSNISKTVINVNGENNVIKTFNSIVHNCNISIDGSNNQLILKDNVKLRRSIINIRGSNCKIIIGNRSSFGEVRLVNVGKGNDILIGKDCLFADNIEIWASDTHSIFDGDDKLINPERPISIGDKVWIGSHVKILKGVNIGGNAIVGMGSMVTKDIKAGDLCVGNPLRVIKENVTWSLKN